MTGTRVLEEEDRVSLVTEVGEVSVEVPEGGDSAVFRVLVRRPDGSATYHRWEACRQHALAWTERASRLATRGWRTTHDDNRQKGDA